MSIAARFAKLLASSIDPQNYNAIRMAAEQRVKTLHDCMMEVAETTMDKAAFRALVDEAEEREEQAAKMAAEARTEIESPKPPPQPEPQGLSHVQVRIAERYSMEVTKAELDQIARLIKDGSPNAKLLKQVAVISTHYEVQIKGKRVRVIYDPKNGRLVTAVPIKNYQKPSGDRRMGSPKEEAWAWRDEDNEP